MLQVQHSLRPEVEWMAVQMLDEAGWTPNHGGRSAIDALFWGFRNRFRYTHDPWELDLFSNLHRAWIIGGGSPDGDLSKGGTVFEDCDGAVIGLLALAVATAYRTRIRRAGAKVIGPGREFTHIYTGLEDENGEIVYLDPTVSTAGPGWQAPRAFRKSEKFFWFNPSRDYSAGTDTKVVSTLSGLGTAQQPNVHDLDRSTPRNRIDGIVRRVYRSLRDPVTRTSAITMLREAGCPARDDLCDATAIHQGVRNRFWTAGPTGGSVRTLGQIAGPVGDSVETLVGDFDDAAMAICSLTLSIGFRSGVRTLPNGHLNAIVEIPRSQSKKVQHRILDLPLESNVPLYASGGTASWYSESH